MPPGRPPKKQPKKSKPLIKKLRAILKQEPEPTNDQGFVSGDSNPPEDDSTEGFVSGDEQAQDIDEITAPRESIFKDPKGRFAGKRFDGTYNDATDNLMFSPDSPVVGFDSEWVRFLNQLSADETTKSFADYLQIAALTRRAKYKLMIYIKTLLDREFTMSNLINRNDMDSMYLDKLLIDADLPLGLTRFDLSPEFQHIINLIRIKFGIKARRSLGGFERININTQRQIQDGGDMGGSGGSMEVKKNIWDTIKNSFKQ